MRPVLTFFNNKGGVGKTSLAYHLAWIMSDYGKKVVIADLDPQANLTAAFLAEDEIDELWNGCMSGATIYQCVSPLTGVSDIVPALLKKITSNLYIIPGDVALSKYEDTISDEWLKSNGDSNLYRPMLILSSFWQVMQMAAESIDADVILADIGPNLGAINRSALISTDYVIIPLSADLFSLQGLKNLGPVLHSWKKLWNRRIDNWKENDEANNHPGFCLPRAQMQAIGYVCQQYSVRKDRPVQAYEKWISRIPNVYRSSVLGEDSIENLRFENDSHYLGMIKHYRSLIPMGQEHRKPIYKLTSADGATGSHANAARDARNDFFELARKITERMGISIDPSAD